MRHIFLFCVIIGIFLCSSVYNESAEEENSEEENPVGEKSDDEKAEKASIKVGKCQKSLSNEFWTSRLQSSVDRIISKSSKHSFILNAKCKRAAISQQTMCELMIIFRLTYDCRMASHIELAIYY